MTHDEIQKLCDGATPGPWRYEADTCEFEAREAMVYGVATVYDSCIVSDKISLYHDGDAQFIASSRTLLPLLLEVAKAADRFTALHDGDCDVMDGRDCSCGVDRLRKALAAVEKA